MRKIAFFLILGCIAAAGSFAQWKTQLYWDFNTNVFGFIVPTGMYADPLMINDIGEPEINSGTSFLDPVSIIPGTPVTAGRYFPKGNYSLFTPRLIHGDDPISMYTDGWLRMHYTSNMVSGLLGFNIGSAIQNFLDGPIRPNMYNLLNIISLEEFFIGIDHPQVAFYLGNLDDPFPVVTAYNDLTEMSNYTAVESFGILVPGGDHLFRPVYSSFRYWTFPGNYTVPVELTNIIADIRILKDIWKFPVTLNAALGADLNAINADIAGQQAASQKRIGGGVALRGTGIADLLDFDLVYKVRGGDGTLDDSWDGQTNTNQNAYQPDGRGITLHYMSLALGLPSFIPDFGVSVAYNTMFPVYERDDRNAKPNDLLPYRVTKKGPVYNGIDVRVHYTGLPNIRLTLGNNISFAKAAAPTLTVINDPNNPEITGISTRLDNGNELDRYHSQDWFALYNALAARYQIDNSLSANVELVHRMSIFTWHNSNENRPTTQAAGWGKSVRQGNIFQVSAFINFDLNPGAVLQAGAGLWLENRKTTNSLYDESKMTFDWQREWKGGAAAFSLPVRLIIQL